MDEEFKDLLPLLPMRKRQKIDPMHDVPTVGNREIDFDSEDDFDRIAMELMNEPRQKPANINQTGKAKLAKERLQKLQTMRDQAKGLKVKFAEDSDDDGEEEDIGVYKGNKRDQKALRKAEDKKNKGKAT